METESLVNLILLIISLFFSFLFSGSEVSLFALESKKLIPKKVRNIPDRYIIDLLKEPQRLLVTILMGNTISNVAASILSVTLALQIAKANNLSVNLLLLLQIIILTIIILLFGEITPKAIAVKRPYAFAKTASIPLYWLNVILYPISRTLTDLIKSFVPKFKYERERSALLSSELKELADLGMESGTIEKKEHDLIDGLVSFSAITVREVMTPRVDITAISVDYKFDEALKVVTDSGHSRIPIYEGNIDRIIGILYAKDLLPFIYNEDLARNLNLKKLGREVFFIPENKLISELMHEFQEKNIHIGIVVDEYGGTAGLISLEDIIEKIVGEIRDEYDKEENEITKLSENAYSVLAKVNIEEFNDELGANLDLENADYDTLGGYIFSHAGEIPTEGYSFEKDGFRFTVKEVKHQRINRVLVEKLEEQ